MQNIQLGNDTHRKRRVEADGHEIRVHAAFLKVVLRFSKGSLVIGETRVILGLLPLRHLESLLASASVELLQYTAEACQTF
mmetsp:Transcript_13943/g.32680  ORF Transcript_13943/g.32680 Transcript_13943/m.32680 type:complete len:81 (+) Transcript_13943:848-1090(+)